MSIFARDGTGLVAQHEPLAQALNAAPGISSFDSLDRNTIVNSLEKTGFNLFFVSDAWARETYSARRRKSLGGIGSEATPNSGHIDEDYDSDDDEWGWPTSHHHQLVKLRGRAAFEILQNDTGTIELCIYAVSSELVYL